MKIKKLTIYLILVVVTGLLLSPVGIAGEGEINDVKRNLPSDISSGEMVEVTLDIKGYKPFMIGIVETIPDGFTFPENDADVSEAEHFKIDRDNGKISFSVRDETEITYNVIPSSNDRTGFEGYWVDMLYQTQELNEGKERWVPVTDPYSDTGSNNLESNSASAADSTEDNSVSSLPGFGGLMTLSSLLICLYILKKYNSGGNK